MGRVSPPARSFAIDQVSRLLALPTDCCRIALSREGVFGWRSDFECAARRGIARSRQSLSPVTSWRPRRSVLRSEHGSTGPTPLTYAKLVDDYLSEEHRDHPGSGCVISALAGDIARSGKRTRALLTEEIRTALHSIADLTPGKDDGPARSAAILTLSALVGAIGLSRAVSDEALSREMLKSVGELLKKELGGIR